MQSKDLMSGRSENEVNDLQNDEYVDFRMPV